MLRVLLLCFLSFNVQALELVETEEPITIYRTGEALDDVKFELENAITSKGFTLNDPLHISEMLQRTGKDLGITQPVYVEAESLSFCSAILTHKFAQSHPAYMVLCPLTLSIYTTTAEPDTTYVAFRKPMLQDTKLSQEITDTFNGIIHDALD
ncbi:hypothetical protein [Candidatus Albibeggiatoa sp. nov. NOAA]|uniref:hypothetical protein n=1 Tax=Candidatus Albibeggiatoa sp. nov. NOAA TaxID=3162724 RepID=UPI0033041081|nr:hypothetical protein [Thiotrichaceae bacterium]